MKSSTETKIMIVLIVSLIAFGLGSGIGISMGMSQDSPFNVENDTIKEVPVNITADQQNTQIQENVSQNNSKYNSIDKNNNSKSFNSSAEYYDEDTLKNSNIIV